MRPVPLQYSQSLVKISSISDHIWLMTMPNEATCRHQSKSENFSTSRLHVGMIQGLKLTSAPLYVGSRHPQLLITLAAFDTTSIMQTGPWMV